MKKNIFLILLCISGLVSHGQSSAEFVEVIAVDTIQADPEEIIYTIYCYDESTTMDLALRSQLKIASKEKASKTESVANKLRAVITRMGIDTVPSKHLSFEHEMYGSGGEYRNEFNLRFISTEHLRLFLNETKEIKGVTGFISEKLTSKIDSLLQVLTNRMLKKAAADAGRIAAQAGRSLGKILQVKEESVDGGASSGGWTVYPPLSAIARNNYMETEKITITRKLIVRFGW